MRELLQNSKSEIIIVGWLCKPISKCSQTESTEYAPNAGSYMLEVVDKLQQEKYRKFIEVLCLDGYFSCY